MAKEQKKEPKASTWDDFSVSNLAEGSDISEAETDEVEQEEEVQEEEEKPKKKVVPKKKEEPKVEKPSVKKAKVTQPELVEEEVEEITEEDEVESSEPEEDSEEGEDPFKFFEEVEKLTGHSVEVEYGEVDPTTPQGIALREKAVREQAVDNLLEEIETNHPAAWKALQHSYNGGDIADLFRTTASRDYSKVDIADGDEVLATEIIKEYLNLRNIKKEATVKRYIEAAQDSEEGIVAEAKAYLEELKTEQEQKRTEVLKQQEVKAQEQKKRDMMMTSAIDEVLETLTLGNFKISSRQEAAEFKKFVSSSLRRAGEGKYELITPIEGNNLAKQLQYEFFKFKKGDLSKLIQVKAATQNAEKLKLKWKAEQASPKRAKEESSASLGGSLKDYQLG